MLIHTYMCIYTHTYVHTYKHNLLRLYNVTYIYVFRAEHLLLETQLVFSFLCKTVSNFHYFLIVCSSVIGAPIVISPLHIIVSISVILI